MSRDRPARSANGLRERKKAKTRDDIQRHALRLFEKNGYGETTVEQIAAAAEISPSTFFRYFPTKEDVVLYDPLDIGFMDAFRSQPRSLSAADAVLAAFRQVAGSAQSEEMREQFDRSRLVMSVPDLRMKMMDRMFQTVSEFTGAIADRVRRPLDDPGVLALMGVILSVGIATWARDDVDPASTFLPKLEQTLARLRDGIDL
jgi:AcrR family transcriptional regulator